MLNIIIMILGLILLYHFLKPKLPDKEIILNEEFLNEPNASYCSFNYDDINSSYERTHKIITDNKKINQVNNNTIKSWQPNLYYDNETKTLKEFNNNNSFNDVIIYSQDNNSDTQDKPIQEIYDDSILDFKKNIQNKSLNNNNIIQCASNLNVISPNEWNYDDEKIENGGEIKNGLFAFDPLINQSVALC